MPASNTALIVSFPLLLLNLIFGPTCGPQMLLPISDPGPVHGGIWPHPTSQEGGYKGGWCAGEIVHKEEKGVGVPIFTGKRPSLPVGPAPT